MIVVALLLIFLLLYGVVEYRAHQERLSAFKCRIHVNGARGKSSVVRLIAAGLREGGEAVVAKTTGTEPRLILSHTEETPLYRPGLPNIIEQVSIIKDVQLDQGKKVLVMECMALNPEYQALAEEKMVRSTIGVITNVRPDHLDVMGPTEEDVACHLCSTMPKGEVCFTAEQKWRELFLEEAGKRGTELHFVDAQEVSSEEMARFTYLEHPENVALALAVCGRLGVSRAVALQGMVAAAPDPGALKIYEVSARDRTIYFANAMAANDPDSIETVYRIVNEVVDVKERKVLVNVRADRMHRSLQLADLIARVPADEFFLTGTFTRVLMVRLKALGFNRARIVDMEGKHPEDIYEAILASTQARKSLLFACGNIKGVGGELSQMFMNRGLTIDYRSYWLRAIR